MNIHVYGNNVYYGMGDIVLAGVQGAAVPTCSTATVGAILSFRNLKVSTLAFKNFTNAANAVVVATGTVT